MKFTQEHENVLMSLRDNLVYFERRTQEVRNELQAVLAQLQLNGFDVRIVPDIPPPPVQKAEQAQLDAPENVVALPSKEER